MKTSLINPSLNKITTNIVKRSQQSRADYLQRMSVMDTGKVSREMLSCGNLAHGVAACGQGDKDTLKSMLQSDIGIISAYNDILSAHQPYQSVLL